MKKTESKILPALKWSVLSELSVKAITPLTFIILAGILTPEDYGIASIALMIISFSQIFWDAGLEKSLIQTKDNIEHAANIVFWTNIALSIGIYIIIFSASEYLAAAFKDTRITQVIQIQSIQIIFLSLCSVQTGLCKRNLNFKTLFWVKLATTLTPCIISIPLALIGFKYWAFVWGYVFGSAAQTIILWTLSDWRPKLYYDFNIAKKMMSFGKWIVGEAFLEWCLIYFDLIIIGFFLTSHDLGLYNFGNKIVGMIFTLIVAPLLPVLYSYLSREQDNFAKIKDITAKSNKIILSLVIPASIIFIALSDTIANIFLGDKWTGISEVIMVFGIRTIISYLIMGNSEAYRAMGRPDLNTKIFIICLLIYLPLCCTAAPYGLKIFIYARLFMIIIGMFIKFYFSEKFLGIKLSNYIYSIKWQILAGLAMFGSIMYLKNVAVTNVFLYLITSLLAGMLVYISIIAFDKDILFLATKLLNKGEKKIALENPAN